MFVGSSRLNYQVALGVELIHAGQVLPDKQIASVGALDVMGDDMLRLIYVVAPERSFIAVANVFIGDRAFRGRIHQLH